MDAPADAVAAPVKRGADLDLMLSPEVSLREHAEAAVQLPLVAVLEVRLRVGTEIEARDAIHARRIALHYWRGEVRTPRRVVGQVAAIAAHHIEDHAVREGALPLAFEHGARIPVIERRLERSEPIGLRWKPLRLIFQR